MTIRHTDTTGHPWTFEIDCTPIQGRMFERLLTSVSTVGNLEQLALSYMEDAEGNRTFRYAIEHALLSALRTWTENRTNAKPKPLPTPPVTPPQPIRENINLRRRRISGTVNTHSPTVADDDTDTDDDGRVHYYWENF